MRHPSSVRVVVASVSAHFSQLRPGQDLSLPPLAANPVALTPEERDSLSDCSARPFLVTFIGNTRSEVRKSLVKLHDGKTLWLMNKNVRVKGEPTYRSSLATARFGAVPRGDNLFSYRLAEVMSAGAVPVVLSDGWVIPFAEVVNVTEFAVVVEEGDVDNLVDILRNITEERRCSMAKMALHLYENYMSSFENLLRGVVDTVDYRLGNLPPDHEF